jgi:hypothetical protein
VLEWPGEPRGFCLKWVVWSETMGVKRKRSVRRGGPGVFLVRVFWLGILGWAFVAASSRMGLPGRLWNWNVPSAKTLKGISFLPRARWHADPPLGVAEAMARPRKITVHHLGGRAVIDSSPEGSARIIKAIQKDHQSQRHWNDIAYHFIVDRGGRIWEGRPLGQMGAHAGSLDTNQANLGILVMGNFDEQAPTPAQLSGLERLLEALTKTYRIARGSVTGHDEVRSHGGLGATRCPGKHLARWLESYRRR